MRGVFDDEELKPAQAKRDTELTLGSGALLSIFFGLLLLCGLCFGLGYTVGHHGAPPPSAANPQPAAGSSAASGNSPAKPAATDLAPPPPPPAADTTVQTPQDAPVDTAPATPAEAQSAVQAANATSQPAVHAALTPAAATGQPAPPSAPQAAGLMVQIAAVSNTEDADVLTAALRKRGYVVTARRDPADNLIHVRIGPFATLDEANRWKMKLLNDGYNAIVQP